jgi:hypothetical protein
MSILRGTALAVSLISAGLSPASAETEPVIIKSAVAKIDVSYIAELHVLRDRPGLRVQLVVQDLGGSTDMSPTRNMYLAIYAKGEICSMDAVFDLGPAYAVKSVKRTAAGMYEVSYDAAVESERLVQDATLLIDARKATVAVDQSPCADFEESGLVDTEIEVTRQLK